MPSTIRHDIGQLLIGSLPGTTITPEMRSLAKEFSLGGVILFARNIEAPEQVAEMSVDVQGLATDLPLWVSVDQEGGRVARLKAPFTEWPPMAVLGRSGDVQLAERFATALAAELKAVGITLDYAPVLDIHTNPKNPVIGDRALAEDAAGVAKLGAAIIRGLQDNGVAACGKHFPGHGDTSVDSHLELPLVEHPPDRIRRVECVPFREAIRTEVAFIMTAHVIGTVRTISAMVSRLAARQALAPVVRQIWLHYAAWILLSLEFALAADIIRTIVRPDWNEIGQLGAIAAIRIALSYFLGRDIVEVLVDAGKAAP